MRIRVLFFLFGLLALLGRAFGQTTTYPVQVNANILPPYSLYLSDYYSGTRERLAITLVNRDQLKPTLNVRLRMIITAPGGIRIQTNDNVYVAPIQVENGIPLRLTREDLAPYFQSNALITSGYLTEGRLPEGMVEFCFQAIEAFTGQVLSASTCTRAFITSQKPPLLSLPQNNESVPFRDPLNLLFQWTPRHQGLAMVEYEVIIKELWDNGMVPQAAFPYSPEIYRETTRSTSMLYGALQPPLLPGKRYAWCVRAQAREGVDAVNVFQNDGYSEVRTFTLQSDCASPELVKATAERKRLNVSWDPLPQHIGFTVSYRLRQGETVGEWKEQQLLEPQASLSGLKDNGTYEYRVGSYCVAGEPVYSPIFVITLPKTDSARLAQCGFMPDINLANQEPIKTLSTGDVIMANDYPVTITRISGGGGVFTGEGWTEVPWLNDAKVAVQFTTIKVNTDKQLIDGYIDAKYDAKEGQIADLDDVFEGGRDVGYAKTGLMRVDYAVDFSIPGVDAFDLSDDGELIVRDGDGTPHTIVPDSKDGSGNEGNKVVVFPMTVKDKDGVVYEVVASETDADGKPTAVKATRIGKQCTALAADSFDRTQLNADKAIVTFTKGAGVYAFDTWQKYYAGISLIKNKYQKLYTDYYAPWKFLPVDKSDVVQAKITIKDAKVKPEGVIFITPTGTEYEATYANGIYTLQVASGPAGDAQELYALYPDPTKAGKYWTLGKLGIVTYAAQTHKVVLVPVNNAPVDEAEIRNMLKTVYDSIGVTWQVELAPSLAYAENDKLMANSTGLSTYNEAMRELNDAYKAEVAASGRTFDKSANYLFFLKATGAASTNERDYTGFMPRGAQFGYIFTSEIRRADIPQVVAHELGHGRWKLYHPFDSHYGGVAAATNTSNVMSYGKGGNTLAKWQWDIIGDPAMVVSVFEGDERSGSYRLVIEDKFLNKDKNTVSFATYDGSIITIKRSLLVNVTLNYGTMDFNATARQVPGVLQKFTLQENGENIIYQIDVGTGVYHSTSKKEYAEPAVNDDDIDGVILGLPCEAFFVLYKFDKIGLKRYTGSPQANPIKDVIDFPLRPFSTHAGLKTDDGEFITQVMTNVGDCYYCINDFSAEMTSKYCHRPEILYVTKMAQFQAAYPQDFRDFTYTGKGWANPSLAESENFETTKTTLPGEFVLTFWPTYLNAHSALKAKFYDETTRESFFKEMYEQLFLFLEKRTSRSTDFWKNLTKETPLEDLIAETDSLSQPELESLDFEKRKIAISMLIHSDALTKGRPLSLLIGFVKQSERSKMLTFLESSEISIKTLFTAFNNPLTWGDFARVITIVSDLIENPPLAEQSCEKAVAESVVTLDTDMLYNERTEYYRVNDDNSISFINTKYYENENEDIAYPEVFLTVPYDHRIPVYFASDYNLIGDKVYPGKSVSIELPAIFVALMLNKNAREVFTNRALVIVDGIMLLAGVGEAKLVYSTGSWLRKLSVGSAIVGSAVGMIGESLPSSVISEDMRTCVRVLSALANIPEAAVAVRNIGKETVHDLRVTKGRTAVESERKAIEETAVSLEKTFMKAEDIVEDAGKYVRAFGQANDLRQAAEWIGKVNDGRVYIAVHGNQGIFKVIYNGVESMLDHRSLARWLEVNPDVVKGSDIVLLTCADGRAAQDLANKIVGKNKVIAWEGITEVYSSGLIKGEGVCYSYGKATNAGFNRTVVTAADVPKGKIGAVVTETKVVLGDASGFDRLISVLDELELIAPGTKGLFLSDFPDDSEKIVKMFLEEPDLLKAWCTLRDLSAVEALRKNVIAIRCVRDFSKHGIKSREALEAIEAADKTGILQGLGEMLGSSKFRNPKDLPSRIKSLSEELLKNEIGLKANFDETLSRLRQGHDVALDNEIADIADYTTMEAIQKKVLVGKSASTFFERLRGASAQLRGEGGEIVPSGFTKIADLTVVNPDSPIFKKSADELSEILIKTNNGNKGTDNLLRGVDEFRIYIADKEYIFGPNFKLIIR